MARKHVKVVLSGDGGDEVFAGYEHYQAQRTRLGSPAWPPGRSSPDWRRPASGRATRRKGAWNKLRRFTQAFDHDADVRHFRWMMFLSRADQETSVYGGPEGTTSGDSPGSRTRPPLPEVFRRMSEFDRTTGELYLDLKTYLVDDIMVKVDRMSMAASLEAREPLLDHKLIEFAFRLPGRLKLRGLTTKWIFKKTAERLLPKDNIYRRKEGFSIPIKHWLRVELRDMMENYLSEKRIAGEGLFRHEPIRAMMDAHVRGRENYSHQLWALLMFEIWRETYLGKNPDA